MMLNAIAHQFTSLNRGIDDSIWSWCQKEISHWKSKRLDFSAVSEAIRYRNDLRPMEFLFSIKGGQVSVARKAPESPDRVPIWRPPLYLNFLQEVVSHFCPDLETDLLINVADGNLNCEPIPIFAFQKPLGSNAILLPDVDFLEYKFYYTNPSFIDSNEYLAKTCSAVFVGATTGGALTKETVSSANHPRLRSALFFRENPNVDFRLPLLSGAEEDVRQQLLGMGFGKGDRLSYHQQFKHRFLISMDGWGATCSRLPVTLRSASVLLKYDSPHQLYYFNGLIPWQHYIPIACDEDVNSIIRLEEHAPGSFASIARMGKEFADRYLTRLQAMKYTAWLLCAYADSFASSVAGQSGWRTASPRPAFIMPTNVSEQGYPADALPSLEVTAHISDRGDVLFPMGESVGEVRENARIEGFSLEPGFGIAPSELEYSAVGEDGLPSPVRTGGMFCGTTGKRQPLYGLAARTAGELARYWDCEYTASFDDDSEIGPVRQGVPCRTETGAQLRSFRIDIVPSVRIGPFAKASPALDDPTEVRNLFMRFESLGGAGHGCEFGLAQRYYGAEPLGLLRWADLGFDQLVNALEARFEGVGDPENTVIFSPEHAKDEYWTLDKRYHMAMRTFVQVADVPYERMVKRVTARLTFLRAKLIEDLTLGYKIFVYKNMYRNLTDQELEKLQTIMHSYGSNLLLYLAYADREHPHGTVEYFGPGLFIGYMERFAFSADNNYVGPSHDLFLEVCKSAGRMIPDARAQRHE